MLNTEFVLVRGQWFLAKDGRSATNQLKSAKRFKTWQSAARKANNTTWKYTSLEDYWQDSEISRIGRSLEIDLTNGDKIMAKQEIEKIEKLQNQACGLLNRLDIGECEAMTYTHQILFDLSPETAEKDLTKIINQLKRII